MTTVEEILTQNVPDLDEAVFDYVCGRRIKDKEVYKRPLNGGRVFGQRDTRTCLA